MEVPEELIRFLDGGPHRRELANPERKPLLKPQHDGLRRPAVTKEKPDVEAE